MHCVVCGKKLNGDDHHCDPRVERRIEHRNQKPRNPLKVLPSFDARLNDGFFLGRLSENFDGEIQ